MQRAQGVLLFLVRFNNSTRFEIYGVTRSSSSRPFLCTLDKPETPPPNLNSANIYLQSVWGQTAKYFRLYGSQAMWGEDPGPRLPPHWEKLWFWHTEGWLAGLPQWSMLTPLCLSVGQDLFKSPNQKHILAITRRHGSLDPEEETDGKVIKGHIINGSVDVSENWEFPNSLTNFVNMERGHNGIANLLQRTD